MSSRPITTTFSSPSLSADDATSAELDAVRAALDADYEVLEEIGRGGMAVVYRARERELDREVAIKVLPFALTFDADVVERFLREARTSAQLEHPHIVPIYRVGRAGQVIYFAMKLLRGETLSTYLERHGQLPAWEVRRILLETAGALGYAAERRVVHRDVKPDNIMLDEERRCVVTDFGIARSASDASLTATGITVGTPRYMSPEQARGRPLDGRSDIYSLGVVGYEMLAGRVPFAGDDALAILLDHVQTPVPRPALESDDARRLYRVIERMLAKRPEDRFRSTGELLAALANGATVPVRPGAPPRARGLAGARTIAARAVAALRPALDRALDASRRLLREQRPSGEALISRAAALGPRFWTRAGGVLALAVAAYVAFHLATTHRSSSDARATAPHRAPATLHRRAR
ncbi:MAG TPA: serine/threonine-protein kinase [Gemmatimonadaceae bacterium]|nr:serine/threonine-protein kinase [Gemmatimonadaceae bacterium]